MINEYFNKLRFDENHHLGMGDIRLTIGQQEEIVDMFEPVIFFVGMHNKKGLQPLDSSTKSGKIIDAVINQLPFTCYKTNLCEVEYQPKDWLEINEHGIKWGEKYSRKPKDVIVLLGKWVQENFFWNDCNIVKVPHPASVMGSKEDYISMVIGKVKGALTSITQPANLPKQTPTKQ